MSRVKVVGLVLVVTVCLGWTAADDGSFTVTRAKKLIPEAAGLPAEDLIGIMQGGNPAGAAPKNGDSLTWVVLNLVPDPEAKSFRYASEQPNPVKLAGAICGPKRLDGSYRPVSTAIHREYITDCTATVDGGTATGTVTFKAEGAYEGAAEYTARKKDGAWRIEEFRLPDLKVTLVLGADGKWAKK
ncbi:hypothetical protein [Gemmata sp.]|uniref:hypothetical protein n=1 Tax=Gemmata sp. TaxID=1914242 RepID=UPI003F713C71